MFYISEIRNTAPEQFTTELQETVYRTLQKLRIRFERVDTDPVISMDDCVPINEKMNMKMVKTLFLCNRQKNQFYLFVMNAETIFRSKEISHKLQLPHLTFVPMGLFESMLGSTIGAATIFSVILDTKNEIKVLIEKNVASEEYIGCSDGTNTSYLKIKTTCLINFFLDYAKHKPLIKEM